MQASWSGGTGCRGIVLAAKRFIPPGSPTQQQAFSTNFFVLSRVFILSGFVFPTSSMPRMLQWLTYINPLRYDIVVIRGTPA